MCSSELTELGLGAMDRLLDIILSFDFSDINDFPINGFISGHKLDTITMHEASAVCISLSFNKVTREKLLNNELINIFSRLVAEMKKKI